MTSASFAEAGLGPNSTAGPYRSSPPEAHSRTSAVSTNNNNNTSATTRNSNNPSFSNESGNLHAHRQNNSSSKLPAFRFVDLKKNPISLPTLLQHIPPSPNTASETPQKAHNQTRRVAGSSREATDHGSRVPTLPNRPASFESQQQNNNPPRTRSLKVLSNAGSANSPAGSKRPASFPDTPRVIGSVDTGRSQLSYITTPVTKRRLTASTVVQDAVATNPARSHLSSSLLRGPKTVASGETDEATPSTESKSQGQRELLLAKTIDTPKSEDKKASRPPVSYRPPNASSTSGGRAVIPPIRSFRSSGSRKSVVLDMHGRRVSGDSYGEEASDSSQRERALRALEGQSDEDFVTPPESGDLTTTTDNDNTADIFMRIAGEDSTPQSRPPLEVQGRAAEQSAISQSSRSSHRRPLSAAIPSYQTSSPPQISRRLSDQLESARKRADSQSAQEMTRELAYRTASREHPPSVISVSETSSRVHPVKAPLKPSPITPRQVSFRDSFAESASASQRRRASVTENNNLLTRPAQYRGSNMAATQGRTYNSSPLVPRSANAQKDEPLTGSEANHGVEGTESSSSTAAPSTVWDDIDDLKSRIHRLELTGKIAPASGGSTYRTTDDRPPTAMTNATTMSASPKRGSGASMAQAETSSNAAQQRDTQPLLLSALSKTKNLVSPDIFSAIESAATDALALSSMLNASGQAGPMSSGSSTVGFNSGFTERQLRRKADSICRSLTELCIALTGELGQHKQSQLTAATRDNELLLSPTSISPAAASVLRRPSDAAEAAAKPGASPRAPTVLEQRRQTMLAATVLPNARYAAAPSTPMEPASAGRKSSLLLARIRRAATEEPEELSGRRSSLLLRTRRAETEEPEESREGRKTSLLLRTRKTMNEEEDESRFRAPSRAATEVNGFRAAAQRDLAASMSRSPTESSPLTSALSRRRLLATSLNTRLVTINNASDPASAPVTPARRYLERGALDREQMTNSVVERIAEERAQRQLSLSQTAIMNRTSSFGSRRIRESGIPSLQSPGQSAQAGPERLGGSGREGGYYR